MPQLNIYVPEELAEVLQRHREALNLSQICARALRQEVQKMELAAQPHGGVNVARILARLRDAEPRQLAAYRDGTADAARWMEEEATPQEMARFAEWDPDGDYHAVLAQFHTTFADKVLAGAFLSSWVGSEMSGAKPGTKATPKAASHPSKAFLRRFHEVHGSGVNEPEYWPSYVKGWQQTVAATWSEIKDQLS